MFDDHRRGPGMALPDGLPERTSQQGGISEMCRAATGDLFVRPEARSNRHSGIRRLTQAGAEASEENGMARGSADAAVEMCGCDSIHRVPTEEAVSRS
jgi:hypothetical protein